MIWPMANSQMLTSKNPSGARVFMPRDTKIVFMVARVTTHNSATKTSRGSRDDAGAVPSANRVTGPPPQQERRLHGTVRPSDCWGRTMKQVGRGGSLRQEGEVRKQRIALPANGYWWQ